MSFEIGGQPLQNARIGGYPTQRLGGLAAQPQSLGYYIHTEERAAGMRLLSTIIMLYFLSSPAFSQLAPLHGLKEIALEVEKIDLNTAKSCNINERDLYNEAAYNIANYHDIKLKNQTGMDPVIIVNLTISPIQNTNLCVFNLFVQAFIVQNVKFPYGTSATSAIILFQDAILGITPKTNGMSIRTDLSNRIKKFIVEHARQN